MIKAIVNMKTVAYNKNWLLATSKFWDDNILLWAYCSNKISLRKHFSDIIRTVVS